MCDLCVPDEQFHWRTLLASGSMHFLVLAQLKHTVPSYGTWPKHILYVIHFIALNKIGTYRPFIWFLPEVFYTRSHHYYQFLSMRSLHKVLMHGACLFQHNHMPGCHNIELPPILPHVSHAISMPRTQHTMPWSHSSHLSVFIATCQKSHFMPERLVNKTRHCHFRFAIFWVCRALVLLQRLTRRTICWITRWTNSVTRVRVAIRQTTARLLLQPSSRKDPHRRLTKHKMCQTRIHNISQP